MKVKKFLMGFVSKQIRGVFLFRIVVCSFIALGGQWATVATAESFELQISIPFSSAGLELVRDQVLKAQDVLAHEASKVSLTFKAEPVDQLGITLERVVDIDPNGLSRYLQCLDSTVSGSKEFDLPMELTQAQFKASGQERKLAIFTLPISDGHPLNELIVRLRRCFKIKSVKLGAISEVFVAVGEFSTGETRGDMGEFDMSKFNLVWPETAIEVRNVLFSVRSQESKDRERGSFEKSFNLGDNGGLTERESLGFETFVKSAIKAIAKNPIEPKGVAPAKNKNKKKKSSKKKAEKKQGKKGTATSPATPNLETKAARIERERNRLKELLMSAPSMSWAMQEPSPELDRKSGEAPPVYSISVQQGSAKSEGATIGDIALVWEAVRINDLPGLTNLIKKGVSINISSDTGLTPLHAASERGNRLMVKLLLSSGASIDVKTKNGFTPLHVAAKFGHADIVADLIQAGATTDLFTNSGTTPLHEAAASGRVDASLMLIKLKADPNVRDLHFHLTAANLARINGHSILFILLRDTMTYQQQFMQDIGYLLHMWERKVNINSREYAFIVNLFRKIQETQNSDEVYKVVAAELKSQDFIRDHKQTLGLMRAEIVAAMKEYNLAQTEANASKVK